MAQDFSSSCHPPKSGEPDFPPAMTTAVEEIREALAPLPDGYLVYEQAGHVFVVHPDSNSGFFLSSLEIADGLHLDRARDRMKALIDRQERPRNPGPEEPTYTQAEVAEMIDRDRVHGFLVFARTLRDDHDGPVWGTAHQVKAIQRALEKAGYT